MAPRGSASGEPDFEGESMVLAQGAPTIEALRDEIQSVLY